MNNLFESRAWWFIVDNERGKRLTIRFGDQDFYIGKTEPNGHLIETLKLSPKTVSKLQAKSDMPGWLTYQAVLLKMDKRIYIGRVQLPERKGVDSERFRRACKDIPKTKWTVFREANELKRV